MRYIFRINFFKQDELINPAKSFTKPISCKFKKLKDFLKHKALEQILVFELNEQELSVALEQITHNEGKFLSYWKWYNFYLNIGDFEFHFRVIESELGKSRECEDCKNKHLEKCNNCEAMFFYKYDSDIYFFDIGIMEIYIVNNGLKKTVGRGRASYYIPFKDVFEILLSFAKGRKIQL